MVSKLFSGVNLNPRQLLSIALGVLLVTAALSFGSYALPEKKLTGRRGPVSFIPRDMRKAFVERRGLIGAVALGGVLLLAAGWMGAERLSRVWQKRRNEELDANAVLVRLAPRAEDRNPWMNAGDLWRAIHSSLARSSMQTWLGGGLHISLEVGRLAGEQITYYLWAPRPLAQMLVEQFSAAYPGMEVEALSKEAADAQSTDEKVVRSVDDYLDKVPKDVNWVWCDLGLARAPWRPLRTDFSGDPLGSILSPLRGLSSGNNLAAIHFIVRPATGNWMQGGNQFIAKLRGDNLQKGQPRPRLSAQDRALIKQIEEKGRSPGYDLCLRLVVAGKGDVNGDLDRLIRAFDQFSDDNSLTVRKTGAQTEAYRFRGRFLPAGWQRSVVSTRELAALAHLPNGDLSGLPIDRAGVQVEEPTPVSFVQPGEERVVLGMYMGLPAFSRTLNPLLYTLPFLRRLAGLNEQNGGEGAAAVDSGNRDVGIPLKDARRHFHVIGPTGVGKSTLLLRMVWQYTEFFPDAAVWVQEPHQDLTHKIIKRVPLWREKDIIWLDVMDPKRALGINPMDMSEGADPMVVSGDVMGVMKKVMGASWDTAVQMQEILENALLAILSYEKEPTMAHLLKMLTDENYRFEVTSQIKDPVATPYWDSLAAKKERELDQMFSVPRRRINAFVRNAIVRRIVSQPRSTVNFRHAIDNGKVILVQLDGRMGGQNRTFIGAMMMYKLFGSVMSRLDIEEKDRKQVAICVDEFQTFVGQSADEFADILEQARKMGASLTLAHQHLGQLEGLTNSVANNTGTKVIFRSEAADAPVFLKWLPDLNSQNALVKLQNFRCYVRPMVKGSPQKVCTLVTYADPPVPDPEEELRSGKRGEPDPLPPHPGRNALQEVKEIWTMDSDVARKDYLLQMDEDGWTGYRAARHYYDTLRRNELIEHPEKIPDKLKRVRELVRLGYGTPHFETEAYFQKVMEQ